jgi:hypothetical protein
MAVLAMVIKRTVPVLILDFKHVLVQIKKFVFECSTYSLCAKNVWKRDSHDLINFVYVRSTCSLAVQNKD